MTRILAILTTLALAACAQSPGKIAPVSMTGAYSGASCEQTQAMLNSERANLAALEGQQRGAVAADAFGVFLIGVPMGSLTGGDVAGDISVAKGKVIALEQRLYSCRGFT